MRRQYKEIWYTYSKSRKCWKIYHQYTESFMLMDFESENSVKAWIDSKQG